MQFRNLLQKAYLGRACCQVKYGSLYRPENIYECRHTGKGAVVHYYNIIIVSQQLFPS